MFYFAKVRKSSWASKLPRQLYGSLAVVAVLLVCISSAFYLRSYRAHYETGGCFKLHFNTSAAAESWVRFIKPYAKDPSFKRQTCASSADCMGGTCINTSCVCPIGSGGQRCEFTAKELYQGQDIYKGFKTSPSFRNELDLQGWSIAAKTYEELLTDVNATTVIEVGVWKGLSASIMANWLKRQQRGVLIAVDTWLGAPEFWMPGPISGKDKTRNLHRNFGYPGVYYSFLSNVIHQELQNFVTPIPLPSALASDVLHRRFKGLQADLVHIDAAHEYDPVREDIMAWFPFVREGGILLGDDYHQVWPGVIQAVNEFTAMCNITLKVAANKWYIKKEASVNINTEVPWFCYRHAL